MPTNQLNWNHLCELEPRLRVLCDVARRRRNEIGPSAAYDEWYFVWKPQVCRLVGCTADSMHPVLRSSAAYDIAYDHILNTLSYWPNQLRAMRRWEESHAS